MPNVIRREQDYRKSHIGVRLKLLDYCPSSVWLLVKDNGLEAEFAYESGDRLFCCRVVAMDDEDSLAIPGFSPALYQSANPVRGVCNSFEKNLPQRLQTQNAGLDAFFGRLADHVQWLVISDGEPKRVETPRGVLVVLHRVMTEDLLQSAIDLCSERLKYGIESPLDSGNVERLKVRYPSV